MPTTAGTIVSTGDTGSVTNTMLAGEIQNSKLVNQSVSLEGPLNLGQSDSTPAFDLTDATNYPTSSLSGTITNSQSSGSISNDKLVHDSITVVPGSALSSTGNEIDLGSTSTLSVNVDDNTIEVNTTSDSLQVKDLSITNSKIANSTIDLTTKVTGTLPIGNFCHKR